MDIDNIESLYRFRLPSLTTAERDAYASPLAGMVIWNETTDEVEIYNGTAWQNATASSVLSSADVSLTLTSTNIVVLHSPTADSTITLPSAVGVVGEKITIKKTNTTNFDLIVDGASAETIDGDLTKTLNTPYSSITMVSDGANWFII